MTDLRKRITKKEVFVEQLNSSGIHLISEIQGNFITIQEYLVFITVRFLENVN